MAHQSLAEELKENTTLMYDNHSNHISGNMLRFYAHDEFIDLVLTAGRDGVEVGAHRLVLCSASNFLLRTCRDLASTQGKTEILLENIEGRSLRSIVNSIYKGSIQLNVDSVYGILVAAKKLEMNHLVKHSCNFIGERINHNNCLGVVTYAEQYDLTALYELARTFALKHFDTIHTSMEFLQLTESQLKQFLTTDDIADISQETLFHSLLAWVGHDPENREKLTYSLLNFVDYQFLDHDFIVRNKESVLKSHECTELIDSWLKWHTPPPLQKLFCIEKQSTNMKIHVYDSELNSWSEEKWPMPALLRDDFGVTVIDKKVIIAGGKYCGQETGHVEYLDLETMEWSQLPPMILERSRPCAIGLNGDLFVVGGMHNDTKTRSVEKFDFTSGKWEEMSPLLKSYRRTDVKCVALNGLLYAYHGDTLQRYDPRSNKWTRKAPGKAGYVGYDNIHIAVADEMLHTYNGLIVQRGDRVTKSWCLVEPFGQMGYIRQFVALNNRLIICGEPERMLGANPLVVKEYDPEWNAWKVLTSLSGVDPNSSLYIFCLFPI